MHVGRRLLTDNRAGTANVLRNLSPVSKERSLMPREQALGNSRRSGNSDSGFSIIGRLVELLSSTTGNDVASIDELISLYKTASSRSLIQHLSAEQMSEVLSICGALSLPLPRLSSIYDSHLVPFFRPLSGNTKYWSFLLKAAKDKERLSHLTLQDRYWVMRACLARIEDGRIHSGKRLAGQIVRFSFLIK